MISNTPKGIVAELERDFDLHEMANIYTLRHFALLANEDVQQIEKWCEEGIIKARRIRGEWQINGDIGDAWLDRYVIDNNREDYPY